MVVNQVGGIEIGIGDDQVGKTGQSRDALHARTQLLDHFVIAGSVPEFRWRHVVEVENDHATRQGSHAVEQRVATGIMVDVEIGGAEMSVATREQISQGDDARQVSNVSIHALGRMLGKDTYVIAIAAEEAHLLQDILADGVVTDQVEVDDANAHDISDICGNYIAKKTWW